MIDLSIAKIAEWTQGSYTADGFIQGVKVDTRFISTGDLYVCLHGERVDGHDFAQQAIDNGAVALLVDRKLNLDIPQILVSDSLEGLRMFARAYRETLPAFFIGITGSNGKTSTKDILYSVLSRVGETIATYKNQNTEIGTYLNLFRMDTNTKYGVFEMGLDYDGDVDLMAEVVHPDAALVMSLAPAHMANFRDIHHIAEQKLRIFAHGINNDYAFYQGDFDEYRKLDEGWHTFGYDKDNEFVVSEVASNNNGIQFKVNDMNYSCNLLGGHQASNCAGIIALLTKMGIAQNVIREGLNHVALTSLRTELVNKEASLVLMDAYKSNPISAKYALDLLTTYDYDGKRIAVLSDMVELGDDSVALHADMLNHLKTLNLSHVYLLGPEFRKASDMVTLDLERFTFFSTFEALHDAVVPLYKEHQMILIKGSRFYSLERLMKEV